MQDTPHYRKMRDQAYREAVLARLGEAHIAPITALVNRLRTVGRGWMPYVAPTYGGVKSLALFIFQDPGPATHEVGGSQLLCHQNDDPSAERFSRLLDASGISHADIMTWNAYPWYVHGTKVTAAQLDAAQPALEELLGLLPQLNVVVPSGAIARRAWRRFAACHPHRRYTVVETLHTSGGGITNGYRHRIVDGEAIVREHYQGIARLLEKV